jgi:hypothetical protein
MYHFTVTIDNPPLAIQRYFTCVDEAQADRFIGWLNEQGLTYQVTYTEPHTATAAIRAVYKEQRLAADHRVA